MENALSCKFCINGYKLLGSNCVVNNNDKCLLWKTNLDECLIYKEIPFTKVYEC